MVHVILVVTRNQHPGVVGCVCQSRQSPGLLDTPKNRRVHGCLMGQKLRPYVKFDQKNWYLSCRYPKRNQSWTFGFVIFWASPKSAVLRWFATDIMWIFFARCCFPKHKSSPVDVTWIFPDVQVHVVGPWFLVRGTLRHKRGVQWQHPNLARCRGLQKALEEAHEELHMLRTSAANHATGRASYWPGDLFL